MYVEISSVLNRRSIVKPMDHPEDLDSLKVGFIENENWGMVFKVKENEVPKKCMFYLIDKHFYSYVALNQILSNAEKFKKNTSDDMKCILDMIKWWIRVCSILLKRTPKVFDSTENLEVKTIEEN
ncbi:unnamed protein product [Lactuca saligna]|uniref:Uncharacterized protein n=1 Tax=Lactuca saligna TaxID=75948 RepID=A0AA36E3K9_LACSI|nr:unnamed protein product [Lactuca saligna]